MLQIGSAMTILIVTIITRRSFPLISINFPEPHAERKVIVTQKRLPLFMMEALERHDFTSFNTNKSILPLVFWCAIRDSNPGHPD